MRLGVLGGTFDPIHIGHLAAAVTARHALGLDRVLLVVANAPWQKVGTREITPAEDRLAMVRAAVADVDGLEASDLEIHRGGMTYTADTLAELARLHPGARLYLIVGSDVAKDLASWERIDAVRELATLAVVGRAGGETPPVGEGWPVEVVEMPAIEVSSSDLRRRAARGAPLDVFVPPGALHCIRERGLYAVPSN